MGNKKSISRNRLKTRTGEIIEHASFLRIGVVIFSIILFCGLYYYFLSPLGHGTDNTDLGFWDAIFFSIVTFSSLGYGNIIPVGCGKIIASIEVLLGLFFIAVFVAKIASERLSALLQLTYSSVNERRLADFTKDVIDKSDKIDKALSDHNHVELNHLSKKTFAFMSSLYKYLQFHIAQGGYDSFSHMAAPRRLYKTLVVLQQASIEAVRTFGADISTITKFNKSVDTIEKISLLVAPLHQNSVKTTSILNQIEINSSKFKIWNNSKRKNKATLKYRSEITPKLLEIVKLELSKTPCQKHLHKHVAKKLRISNSLAQKCIDHLIEIGEYVFNEEK